MIVRIETGAVQLCEADDLKSLRVDAVSATPSSVEQALRDAGAGRLEGEHAWIDPAFITRQAASEPIPKFSEDFASMLEYARAHGYIAPDGFIRAHIEWL